jgi:hypothetical protein
MQGTGRACIDRSEIASTINHSLQQDRKRFIAVSVVGSHYGVGRRRDIDM